MFLVAKNTLGKKAEEWKKERCHGRVGDQKAVGDMKGRKVRMHARGADGR
jgi:hypothetical protein